MKVLEKLNLAVKSVGSSNGSRGGEIDLALGGTGVNSFAIGKTIGKHLQSVPALYGRKSILEVLGCGSDDGEHYNKHEVKVSINFGKKNHAVPDELRMVMLELKKDFHNCLIQQQLIAQRTKMPTPIDKTPYFMAVLEPKLKAFSLSGFSDWVPTLNTRFFFEEYEIEPAIEKYFEQIPMMSLTEKVPGATARLKGKLQLDTDTFTAQYNTSGNYTYTAQDCVCHTDITEDLMQDMVPQSGSFDRLRKEVLLGVRRSKEDAIINGDDTITTSVQGDGHMDSDVAGGAATLFNKAFKGLRKRAIAAGAGNIVDNLAAIVDRDTFANLLLKAGKMTNDKGDLLWIVGPAVSNRIVTGGVPELLTLNTFGMEATLITGNMPKIFGVEPYESEWVREDVNATGVYAGGATKTSVLLVKKSRFVIGQRAPVKIWATPSLANQDKMLLTAKERFTFGGVPQSTPGEKSAVIAYNVAQ
jgi:hypothetical protein